MPSQCCLVLVCIGCRKRCKENSFGKNGLPSYLYQAEQYCNTKSCNVGHTLLLRLQYRQRFRINTQANTMRQIFREWTSYGATTMSPQAPTLAWVRVTPRQMSARKDIGYGAKGWEFWSSNYVIVMFIISEHTHWESNHMAMSLSWQMDVVLCIFYPPTWRSIHPSHPLLAPRCYICLWLVDCVWLLWDLRGCRGDNRHEQGHAF